MGAASSVMGLTLFRPEQGEVLQIGLEGLWVQHGKVKEPVGSGSPGTWAGLGQSQSPPNPSALWWGFAVAAPALPCRKVPMFGLEAVWRDGKVVGHIRRADFGFAIDKTIAYGYIRDPAGGPVSAEPREGCASFPALAQTLCWHLGCEVGQQLPRAPPVQAGG